MITLAGEEKATADAIKQLYYQAGSHSPSIFTIVEGLPQLKIKVDACFLSNPYATDLVLEDFTKELIHTNKVKKLIEFYPSQNQVIADVLSKHLNVPAKNIFIGNGASEIIQAVIHNFTAQKIIVSIPTFSPPQNPSFPFGENPQIPTDVIPMHKGYDQKRPLGIRNPRRIRIGWNAASRETKDYIFSFFHALNGTTGPFYWTPCDKVPDPTGASPTLTQTSGGALSERTYYVVFTWYDASYGETKQSGQSSLTISANYYMRVSVPIFPTWISSWRPGSVWENQGIKNWTDVTSSSGLLSANCG